MSAIKKHHSKLGQSLKKKHGGNAKKGTDGRLMFTREFWAKQDAPTVQRNGKFPAKMIWRHYFRILLKRGITRITTEKHLEMSRLIKSITLLGYAKKVIDGNQELLQELIAQGVVALIASTRDQFLGKLI